MSKVKLVSKPKIANIRESLFSKICYYKKPKGFHQQWHSVTVICKFW